MLTSGYGIYKQKKLPENLLLLQKTVFLGFIVADTANNADRFSLHKDRGPDLTEIVTVVSAWAASTERVFDRVGDYYDLSGLNGVLHDIAIGCHTAPAFLHAAASGYSVLLIV